MDLASKIRQFLNQPRVGQQFRIPQQPVQRAISNFNPLVGQAVRQIPRIQMQAGRQLQQFNAPRVNRTLPTPIAPIPKQVTNFVLGQNQNAINSLGRSFERAGTGQFASKGNKIEDIGNALTFLPPASLGVRGARVGIANLARQEGKYGSVLRTISPTLKGLDRETFHEITIVDQATGKAVKRLPFKSLNDARSAIERLTVKPGQIALPPREVIRQSDPILGLGTKDMSKGRIKGAEAGLYDAVLYRGENGLSRVGDTRVKPDRFSTTTNPTTAEIFKGDKGNVTQYKLNPNAKVVKFEDLTQELRKTMKPEQITTNDVVALARKKGFDAIDKRGIKLEIRGRANPNLKGFEDEIQILNEKAVSRVAQPMSQAQDSLRSQPSQTAGLYDVAIAKRQGFNSVEEYKNWFLQNKDAFPESMVDNRIQSINSDIAKIKNQISDLKANTGKETGQVNLISGKKQIIDNSRIVKQLEAKLPQYEQDLQEALLNKKFYEQSRVAQQPLSDVPKAKLSKKALSEGITTPRKGSDIAVPTQVGIKARVSNQMKELNAIDQSTQVRSIPPERIKPQIVAQSNQDASALQSMQQSQTKQQAQGLAQSKSFDDIIRSNDINVKNKVGLLDYLRTPDRVLTKMGLGNESKLIRQKYDDYLSQLPKEIDKITAWSKQVSPESNQRIFKYLDGQPVQLDQNELRVANEVRGYLADWADKLKLPQDRRITNYITHIFDKDFVQKEFDPEIAKLIRDRVPGSVYDPFVEQRLGKAGYVEDTWQALDAYVKRATRKYNMDDALQAISSKADSLEDSQYQYVKAYLDRVNMRPTQLDNHIDNTVKQIIGYRLGQRPTAYVTKGLRQMVYRGTLGLNIGSAMRNITQGANTYAKLGERYTVEGYYKLAKALMSGSDELERVGVLKQDFINDRSLNATKKFWEKADKALFYFFETAEKINRGSAYYGAKAKALNQGMSEEQAIKYAKDLVRQTQFTFGSVDTPRLLQGDLAKSLLQFQSFNIKQSEFLAEMVKNKEYAGLVRFGLANAAIFFTIGQLIGIRPQDLIPFSGVLTGDTKLGQTPPVKIGMDIAKTVAGAKDEYGNQPDLGDRASTFANDLIPFIPGGVQIKKTVDFLQDNQKGYDASRTGRVKYPIQQTPDRFIRGALFGSNNLPEARDYYNNKRSVLSENQTEQFKQAADPGAFYNQVMQARGQNKAEDELKAQVEKQGGSSTQNDKIYYNDNGSVKSIDLSPPTTGKGIDAFTNQNWNYTKAREIWKAQTSGLIDDPTASQAYAKLGVDKEDVRYDYLAHHTNDIKTQYILSKNLEHDELIKRLLTGRVVSVSGKQFAADGVINNLRDEGYITDYEAKALKKLKVTKDGKPVAGVGRVGRAKKVKTAKFPSSLPKSTAKIKKTKALKVKLGRSKSTPKKVQVKISPTYEKELAQIARSTGAKV